MIYLYIIGGLVIALNIVGRYFILRKDDAMQGHWPAALKLCPGADILYILFRWEHARLGCSICAMSMIAAVPVAHQIAVRVSGGKLAHFLAPAEIVSLAPETTNATEDLAKLKRLAELKERKLTDLNE